MYWLAKYFPCSLDLEILKTEMSGGGTATEGAANSLQVRQLEQQNSRLRETLVKWVLSVFSHIDIESFNINISRL